MKEIRIKVSSIFREIVIWFILLIAAFLTNVHAINKYDGQWTELWSQFHVVLILSVVYYVLAVILRGIIYGIFKMTKAWIIPAIRKARS